jgi:hypothetical protein
MVSDQDYAIVCERLVRATAGIVEICRFDQ